MRMDERYGLGMEHQARVVLPVQPVADNGSSEAEGVRGVDSESVQAAGARRERYPRPALGSLRDAPLGDGVLAVRRVDDVAGTIAGVGAKRQLDDAVLTHDVAFEPGDIALVGLASRELPLERSEGLGIPGDEQQ